MEITTHVTIPACWGLPDISFSVKTVGREVAYEAAYKIYSQMRKDAGLGHAGRIPSCTLKTDEQHVVDCRAEVAAVLTKYNVDFSVDDEEYGRSGLRMGADDVLILDEEDIWQERMSLADDNDPG